VVPSASAASSRIRLDRLLEPGSLTVPSMSLIGAISINSSFSVGQERAFQSMLRVRERVDCMHRHGLPPRLCSSIAHLPPLRTWERYSVGLSTRSAYASQLVVLRYAAAAEHRRLGADAMPRA